jgi:hypothetical protein
MIWTRIVFILLLAFSACTTSVPTAVATQGLTAQLTTSAIPTGTSAITATLNPFSIAERIPYDVNNDIWVYTKGMIESNEPIYFIFSGMEEQEIRLYFQYPVDTGNWIDESNIFDINGNVLLAERFSDSGGWKGKLPSTQDYMIDLIPAENSKGEFIMQIVNTPPRKESGYFTYEDKQNGFEITYSQDDFKPFPNEDLSDVFSMTLDTDKYFTGTILQLSDLVISVEPHYPGTNCSDFLASMYYSTKETINGIPFEKFHLHDAATGTQADLLDYVTMHNEMCYRIFVKTLYMRVDKFPDTGLKDFSRSILYTKIDRLLNTFKFTK